MSVLQRKAQAGKQEHQARSVTVPKAVRLSMAKVADDLFDMALAVIAVSQDSFEGDSLEELVEEDTMLILLDGPDGSTAGISIGMGLVQALIQQQTTGRITKLPEDLTRKPTSTAAALCAPLIDRFFARCHDTVEMPEDKRTIRPYRFGARAENRRLFDLALEGGNYTVLRLTLDIAGGIGQAPVIVLIPEPDAAGEPLPAHESDAIEPPAPRTLEKSVMELPADLTAVLTRIRLPLSQASALAAGDTLKIPADAFDGVSLVTGQGDVIAKGAMGQIDGYRALQLEQPMPGKSARQKLDMEGLPDAGLAMAGGAPDAGLPDVSALPGGDLPDLPDLPDIELSPETDFSEAMPEGLPDLPDLPELPGEGAEPVDLPDLPDLDGDGLPELPDLDDLPDLGDLPDLEDLPKMNTA